MNIKRIIVAAIVLFTIKNLNAQAPDFSGVWVLKEKISLSGVDYGNGLPKQFELKKTKDSIIIERVYESSNGDYKVTESLSSDGNSSSVIRSNSNRISTFEAGSGSSFSIAVSYSDINTGRQTSANFIETWKFDNETELEIMKQATDPNGEKWSMKGIYELKTKEQAAYEQATGKGIRFTQDLTWEQLKETAKRENKYVFVDCFATWCVPCKKMEKEVFSLNMIGDNVNDKFISVRLQMDTTGTDNDIVKEWYSTAHNFLSKYNITGYPTFLFFDADGNAVHKTLGVYEPDEFIELLKNAQNPSQQYYTLLKSYKSGEKDNEKMYHLVLAAKKVGEVKQAEEILADYKKRYLDKLPVDSLLSEKYLKLASSFESLLIHKDGSKSNYFKLLYQHQKEVDGILSLPGFSSFHVNGIITKEEIEDHIYSNGKPISSPDWDKLTASIQKKYSNVNAEKLVLNAQINFYQKKKDWNNLIKCVVKKAEEYGPLSLGDADGSGSDNVLVNALLPHCDDKQILNKAVVWMEQIIHSNAYMYPVAMTYGNYGALLYKIGRRQEGINYLEQCLKARGYTDDQKDSDYFKRMVELLARMKRGDEIDSTWDVTGFF